MSGRRSRSKGARTERSIVNALKASGIAAVRVPLSGAVGGRFAGDEPAPGQGCCGFARAYPRGATAASSWNASLSSSANTYVGSFSSDAG